MIPSQALIGAPLAKLQEDFKLVPLDVLKGYVNDTSVDPSSGFIRTVVAAELARRKRVQDESNAASQPDPTNRPTVAQELAGIPAVQPAQPAPSDQPANFAHGGIIAFSEGSKEPVPGGEESWMNRVNREAHERGVREPNEYLASIKDPVEREKARRALYGPAPNPLEGLKSGLASMGAATKDMLSAPVRLVAGLAEKYLPTPDIPESFYGGDRSSLTPYMDKLRREQAGQSGATDEAALSDLAKFAYGPSWAKDVIPSASSSQVVPAKTPSQAGPATPGKTPARDTTRPAATPAAPAASRGEGIASLADYNKKQAEELTLMGTMPKFTPEQEEAARIAAAKRLSAVQDPYMKTIADLQAKQAQIGESRGGNPFSRAMMQMGLGMAAGMGRPGTALSAFGKAGLGALDSYEKEELGKIDRATKTNQLQIELQKELMKQGVDRVTAGNVAAKEARNIEEDRAKEIRTAAQQRATVRTGIEAKNQLNEYQTGLLEAKQQMLHLQEQLAAARASGNLAQMDIARQKIEIAQGNLNRLVEETARKNIQAQIKTIQDNIPLALSKEGQAQIKALNAQLGALGTGGGGSSTATTNSQFPGFSVGNP